jgi:N-acetylneuraminate synthase
MTTRRESNSTRTSRDRVCENACYVIAEAGVNHNGDLDIARQLVNVAASAGADAVKFQTFKADKLVTGDAEKAAYQKETTGAEESQYEMLRRLELSADAHHQLLAHCEDREITFLSTPFDEQSADFLAELGVSTFKLGSGDLTNLPLLRHVARKGRPMIVSTGMSWLGEVEDAVRAIEDVGLEELTLLHCVSEYPADPAEANLRAMDALAAAFGYPVGYSDHTPGYTVPLAAVARGATVIEKHFTLDRTMDGPDHRASLEPEELTQLVRRVRVVERALGGGTKRPTAGELEVAAVARKSIVAGRDIAAEKRIEAADLTMRRPGTGLAPKRMDLVLGKRAKDSIPEGTIIEIGMLK